MGRSTADPHPLAGRRRGASLTRRPSPRRVLSQQRACPWVSPAGGGQAQGLRFYHLQTLNFFNDQQGWEVAAPGTNGERMGMGRLPGSGERLPGVRTGNGHLTALTPKAMPWVLLGHLPSHPTDGLPHITRGARGWPGAPGLEGPAALLAPCSSSAHGAEADLSRASTSVEHNTAGAGTFVLGLPGLRN